MNRKRRKIYRYQESSVCVCLSRGREGVEKQLVFDSKNILVFKDDPFKTSSVLLTSLVLMCEQSVALQQLTVEVNSNINLHPVVSGKMRDIIEVYYDAPGTKTSA